MKPSDVSPLSFPHPCLVADIGGTNARFALASKPGEPLSNVIRLASGAHADFADTVADAVRQGGFPAPRSFLAAVAGPVRDRRGELTNAATPNGKLVLDGPRLATRLNLGQGMLFNDFEALSLALPFLPDSALIPLGGPAAVPGQPMLVVGAGTGLGVGALLRADGKAVPVQSEGGHAGIGPETDEEHALWPKLGGGRLSAEDLLSGRGLLRLYRGVCALRGEAPLLPDPAAVSVAAVAEGESPARDAALAFLALLGRFAGDMALAFCARGGVFIGGGVTPRLRSLIGSSALRAQFEAKGALADYVRGIPLSLILSDEAALSGLAQVAAQPQAFALDYSGRTWRQD